MPPRQQEPGTSSQSRGTNRQLSVNVSPDAQLIRDHIPHFASLIDKKHQKNQAGTDEDPSAEFVENNGRISERLLDQEEMSTKDKAYQDIQEARGYNTSKSYCAKQVEFLRFCEMRYANRPLATRHQATGDKLLAFLYEKVINRQVRKPGTKHIEALDNSVEEEVSEINKTDAIHKKLSYSTCNVYVSAIVDLWNYQRLMGSNSNESPRTKVITQLLKVVRMREAKNNRENNVDRATSSMANGYTTKEEVMAISKCIYSNGENFYKYSFRNVVAFLMSHYLLLRGESVRNIEFADLQFQELAKVQADGSYPAMLMIFNQGKTNKFNKTQTGACMRNKSVEICPFMAMSFHFFWRWHCEKESFPDMSANGNWFKLRVVHGARPQSAKVEKKKKGKEPARDDEDDASSEDEQGTISSNPYECSISKTTHTRFMKMAFAAANIFVAKKVTHVPRGSASKMADLLGVPSQQIQRMGGWNTDTMSNSYLDSLPRQFMRVMAGFESDASYYLPRAIEEPCDRLKQLVFPWVDYWYDRHSSGTVHETSGSADKFLLLIKCFKTTFLQDAAMMMDVIPEHPIWRHEIFRNPLFLEFQRKVKAHVEENEVPHSLIIERFAPEVQEQLSSINRSIANTMRELNERQKKSDEIQQQMQKVFDNIVTGKQQLQLSFRMDQGNQAVTTTGAVANTSALPRSEDVSQSKQFSKEAQESSPPPDYNNTAVATISLPYNQEGVPLYKMSRQVTTVCDLWDEWTIGRDGFWSVQELEDKWGAKWRRDDRKWFNIRKKIIDSVEDLQLDLGLSPTSAVGVLQKVLNTRHWSLDRLGTELQKGAFFPCEETKRRKLQHF